MTDLRGTKHLYIEQLEDGPKTTRDLVLSLMVSGDSVGKMMAKLRKEGCVESYRVRGVRGNVWIHGLIRRTQALPTKATQEITNRQHEYLQALEDCPKSTTQIAELMKTTRHTAWKLVNRLRRRGFVQKAGTGDGDMYSLHANMDLDAFEVKPVYRNGGKAISDEEKAFARELRERGLVGQRLVEKYHERYPDRSSSGIGHVIEVIRREGCR